MMAEATITAFYQQLQELKETIHAQPDTIDGWCELYDLVLDRMLEITPRSLGEVKLLGQLLQQFCEDFIANSSEQMLPDERRLVTMVSRINISLHQFCTTSAVFAVILAC